MRIPSCLIGRSVVSCAFAFLIAQVAVADEISFRSGVSNPFVDDYQGSASAMIIDGEWENLSYAGEVGVHLRGAQGDARRRILLRFDLEMLRDKMGEIGKIESATLHLYKYLAPIEGRTETFSIYEVSPENREWKNPTWRSAEFGRSWAGAPGLSIPGVDYVEEAIASHIPYNPHDKDGAEIGEIPIPGELIERWIKGDNTGLLLVLDDEDNTKQTLYIYSASEANAASVRPELRIVYSAE